MYGVIVFLHTLICALLIIVVLLQQSRGGGMASVFGGGGGSDALFGGKGATPFFVKLTTGLAIGFFVTSLVLVLMSKRPIRQSAVDKGLQELPTGPAIPEEAPIVPDEGMPVMPEGQIPGGE